MADCLCAASACNAKIHLGSSVPLVLTSFSILCFPSHFLGAQWFLLVGFIRKDSPGVATIASTAPAPGELCRSLSPGSTGAPWCEPVLCSTAERASTMHTLLTAVCIQAPFSQVICDIQGNIPVFSWREQECERCFICSVLPCWLSPPQHCLCACLPWLCHLHQHRARPGRCWENRTGEEELEDECRGKYELCISAQE